VSRSLGLVLCHGGFHQGSCFDLAKARLEAAGFSPIVAVNHPSVGTDPKVTVDDDACNIQAELAPFLDEGKEFIAISHSYGGTPLTIALKGNSIAERAEQGKKGGVRAVIYVTSNMPPSKGASALSVFPPGLDIVDVADGLVTGNAKAKAAFYGPDMADELADQFMAALLPQSQESLLGPASVGLDELTVPAYYILCEKDQTITPETQEKIIATIPTLKKVLRNPGGHCAFITELDLFVKQIIEIADEVEKEIN
jgi:pimeloyl-ACP methyl ester carboxylesterase